MSREGYGTQLGYFCPQCQSIEVSVQRPLIIDPIKPNGGATASCGHCGWGGGAEELIGALAPENEQFWTGERVANVMLGTVARHAAGPLIQVLGFLGLTPQLIDATTRDATTILEDSSHNADAQVIRDKVMQAVLAAAITAAYETAAELTPPFYAKHGDPTQGAATRFFGTDGAAS